MLFIFICLIFDLKDFKINYFNEYVIVYLFAWCIIVLSFSAFFTCGLPKIRMCVNIFLQEIWNDNLIICSGTAGNCNWSFENDILFIRLYKCYQIEHLNQKQNCKIVLKKQEKSSKNVTTTCKMIQFLPDILIFPIQLIRFQMCTSKFHSNWKEPETNWNNFT